jgi:hypothetical protein
VYKVMALVQDQIIRETITKVLVTDNKNKCHLLINMARFASDINKQ